ncbi:MAG TPA: SHOCT domain-containing protein [Streptosporangiaceae bacterium]|jgi:hypothetical protein
MFVRRRPLMRAAVIGGGAYMVGKNRGQQQAESGNAQGGSQQSAPPAAPSAAPAGPDGSSMTDQLNRLSGLHQQGALSDSEFAAAKAKLLGT